MGSSARGPITPAIMRALLKMRSHEPFRGSDFPAIRRAHELGLVDRASAPSADLTLSGELVLAAYKLGRSRWGAHG